jgi:hypothetical protein
MEMISHAIMAIVTLASAVAAVFFYADGRADKRFIRQLSELLEVERKEKLEWAGKALTKHGAKPLFHTPEKTEDPTPARRVVTRTEAKSRVEDTIDKAKQIIK